ncbi:PREDICTED: tubulin-specific chaperone E [Nicrophorus vespilloides]|uniref:Tubulin-specific chaperone E n=1 Tax=Nicrophorus vespilloides TaxID=110193 RepID=A0ABM1N5L6_NICVS|nr:PREDICTED: tubulin-specific chaperone E [Nicrophorus vespilloides]XP_017782116.1 PREDICTED: tubulin-specific chaperone E [Nicrophorus vespilloides]
MKKENDPNVEDRVECQGSYGTIKYIGEVDGHSGTWLGVEWDDSDRGKHDGSVKNIEYFKARSATSGSFVRPEKIELGQSIISAITTRYGQKDDETEAKHLQQQLLSTQQTMNAPFLQLVGFDKITDKQRKYNELHVINVRMQKINHLGKPREVMELCPNIWELDLSKNLINSWSLILQLCSELKSLKILNVSENILTYPIEDGEERYESVTTLICGSMKLNWEGLLKMTRHFPNLEEFIAPKNNVMNLDIGDSDLQKLKILHIDQNDIGSWSEICKLGHLPDLELLNVESTGIKEIRFPEEGKSKLFRNLKMLYLKENFINDWESVGELNKLENLIDLRLIKNPIFEHNTYDTCAQYIIARIANLMVLDGQIISEERKGAEYDYLRINGIEWLKFKDDDDTRADFLRRFNRYQELVKKYGELEESELKVQSNIIQVSLINVNLVYEDRVISKKLPPTILVQKLIMLTQKLFQLSERPTLIYESALHDNIKIELADECKELGVYSIQNDDRIVVRV